MALSYSFVRGLLFRVPFDRSSSSYPCHVEGFFLELLSRMPALFWGILWSASFTRCRFFGPCPLLYGGLLPGASLCMPSLFQGVQWSAYLSGLCRASLVLQLLSFAIWRASSWSFFCACPLYLGASSGVPVCLASIMRLSSCHFILGVFLGYPRIDPCNTPMGVKGQTLAKGVRLLGESTESYGKPAMTRCR